MKGVFRVFHTSSHCWFCIYKYLTIRVCVCVCGYVTFNYLAPSYHAVISE